MEKTCLSKFRFQGIVYSAGDAVILSDGDSGYYIAKICKIIRSGGIAAYKNWPTIQVQWYYRKNDISISKSNAKLVECMQENEVLESNHYDIVIIESIISKCRLAENIVESKQNTNDTIDKKTFFVISFYNHNTVS